MLRIEPCDPRAVEVALDFVFDLPAVAVIGTDDGRVVGTGGLAWSGGRCLLWFATVDPKPKYARTVLRMAEQMKRKAKQFGETAIYAHRDPRHASSLRLLKLTGFRLHGVEDGYEVFRCDL